MDDLPSSGRYLLLLACSQRKRQDGILLPAMERYDGGNYRLLRKALREGYLSLYVDIVILSAKFGLIDASTLIPNYEQRMDKACAKDLRISVEQTLQKIAERQMYQEIYVELGQEYLLAVDGLTTIFEAAEITYAHGRIGERLSMLKKWLVDIHQREMVLIANKI